MRSVRRIVGSFFLIGLMFSASGVQAQENKQEQPSPEEVQRQMEQVMGPMMGMMIQGMAKSLARPEVAEDFATFMRNYYQALVKKGFSQEEALKIVTAGVPSMGGKQ